MDKSTKVVVIGAGSKSFSTKLIHDLVLDRDLLGNAQLEVVLVDVEAKKLQEMLAYAKQCNRLKQAGIRFAARQDRREALTGADFVILSVAVKRMALWEQDFRVPISFGFKHITGENGGPGSLFHALRNFNVILPICRDIERICPEAMLLNFTNPEARILTAILTLTKINAVGLCHGFREFHELTARVLDRPLEELDIRTAGMNHFFACFRILDKKTNEDLKPQFEQRVSENPDLLQPLAGHLWRTFGVLGMNSDDHIGEYIRYAHEHVGTRWLFGRENRKVLAAEDDVALTDVYDAWRFKRDLAEYLDSGDREYQKEVLSGKQVPAESAITSSGELAVAIIGDILLNRKILRPAVNVLNTEGYIENLSREGCIEVPAVVDAGGIHPEHIGSLPEGFAAQIRIQHSIQKLLVEAFARKSKQLLLQALLLDPVVDSSIKAEQMLNYMLEIQAEYLPDFS